MSMHINEPIVQLKINVPITIKTSITAAAHSKGMTTTDYLINLHTCNLESPAYSNHEHKAALLQLGMHLQNAKQSIEQNLTQITHIELKKGLELYETLMQNCK